MSLTLTLTLLITAIMVIFASMSSAVPLNGLTDDFGAIGPRGIQEFDHSSNSAIVSRTIYLATSLGNFAILVFCFSELMNALASQCDCPFANPRSL